MALAQTAERLRMVRHANERFLALWAVDHLIVPAAVTGALAAAGAHDDCDPASTPVEGSTIPEAVAKRFRALLDD